jgi:hypothetical protein
MKVKVTEAQLDKLRAKKTPERAIAAYKGDPKMREALYRFYGKDRVNKAIGKTVVDSKPKPQPKPATKMGPDVKGRFNKAPSGKKQPIGMNIGGAAAYTLARNKAAWDSKTPNAKKKAIADSKKTYKDAAILTASALPVGRGIGLAANSISRANKAVQLAKAAKAAKAAKTTKAIGGVKPRLQIEGPKTVVKPKTSTPKMKPAKPTVAKPRATTPKGKPGPKRNTNRGN